MEKMPLISVIIPTYNRANTLGKAIQSVIDQTYINIEIIVIDDGSTDDTNRILNQFSDERIRIIRHENNKGVCAAKNTGFDNIRGEWFFIVDSDDKLLPTALEELIRIPLYVDSEVNHVTCNIVEYETNKYLGRGFNKDQYWDKESIYTKTKGEFTGLVKTSILGNDRLNENIVGRESILWSKVGFRSKGYYVHKGLYIVHKEGEDRVCKQMSGFSLEKKAFEFKEVENDYIYWSIMEKYSVKIFLNQCLRGIIISKAVGDNSTSELYITKVKNSENVKVYFKFLSTLIGIGSPALSRGIFHLFKFLTKT